MNNIIGFKSIIFPLGDNTVDTAFNYHLKEVLTSYIIQLMNKNTEDVS